MRQDSSRSNRWTLGLATVLAAGMACAAFGADGAAGGEARDGARFGFADGTRVYAEGERPTMIAGGVLARGATARGAAEAFLAEHGGVFGDVELVAGSLASDGAAERGIMPGADGAMRFTVAGYVQRVGALPVFEAELRLLVRNGRGGGSGAVTLAASTLKPMGGFAVTAEQMEGAAVEAAVRQARVGELANAEFDAPELVVWAGPADTYEAPRLALVFRAVAGAAGEAGYAKKLVVADAADGSTLLVRDLVVHADIVGTTRGMATEGYRSASCNPESSMVLPFVRVTDGTTTVFSDGAGAFTLGRANNNAVNLTASLRGRWFRVFSPGSDAPGLPMNGVTPPGPADFVFNAANTVEVRRSEVNAYLHANLIRSQCLAYAPTFPVIGTQSEFRINVNMSSGTAFYDGNINFGMSGAGIDSLAMGDVVEHEYGHHLVAMAGSGQGPYGEGYGDLMALLNSDSPINGRGYNPADCNGGVRTADNTINYPCSNGDPHWCGQLLTGVFWELQEELLAGMDLSAAREVIRPLAYNSVMMHTGDQVSPSTVTEPILALDDDDDDVNNGTPHVFEILAGFGRKNMAVTLPNVTYTFPDGLPQALSATAPTPVVVHITPGIGRPRPETARVMVRGGSGEYVASPLTPTAPGSQDYTRVIPPMACGTIPTFYFAIDGTRTFTSPADAPTTAYSAEVGTSTDRFVDQGETSAGWSASGLVVRGAWVRGVPVANGTTGAPRVDGDGSGSCWITGNDGQDVDGSSTVLTSPRMDASGPLTLLSYRRWYYNSAANATGTDTMLVEVSGDDGATWRQLELVGPTGPETHGGWVSRQFTVPAEVATDGFRVRFTARDGIPDSTIEAGVDAVTLRAIACSAGCAADFNGDGFLDFFDYGDFVACFEGAGCPQGRTADFNADGFADFFDYADYIDAFAEGC